MINNRANDSGFVLNGKVKTIPAFFAVASTFTPTASSEILDRVG